LARDHAAAYARRDARARAEGYRSYYDKRTAGARTTEERRRLGGHRSLSDLRDRLSSGVVRIVDVVPYGTRNQATGRYEGIEVVVTKADGTEETYRLHGKQASARGLNALAKDLEAQGIDISGIDYMARQTGRRAA